MQIANRGAPHVTTAAPPLAPVWWQPVMDASSAAVVLPALADFGLLPQCCDVVLCVSRGALLQHSAARQWVPAEVSSGRTAAQAWYLVSGMEGYNRW